MNWMNELNELKRWNRLIESNWMNGLHPWIESLYPLNKSAIEWMNELNLWIFVFRFLFHWSMSLYPFIHPLRSLVRCSAPFCLHLFIFSPHLANLPRERGSAARQFCHQQRFLRHRSRILSRNRPGTISQAERHAQRSRGARDRDPNAVRAEVHELEPHADHSLRSETREYFVWQRGKSEDHRLRTQQGNGPHRGQQDGAHQPGRGNLLVRRKELKRIEKNWKEKKKWKIGGIFGMGCWVCSHRVALAKSFGFVIAVIIIFLFLLIGYALVRTTHPFIFIPMSFVCLFVCCFPFVLHKLWASTHLFV